MPGSILTSCTDAQGQEERQLKIQRFSDRSCSTPYKNNSIASSTSYLSPSSCAPYDESGSFFATADYDAAAIYCRQIVDELDFATRVGTSSGAIIISAGATVWMLAFVMVLGVTISRVM